jgi:predicted O-methyltransferase YrrM
MPATPLISTTVLNWNRADLLKRALESYQRTISVPYEVFIIDNASTDDSPRIIEAFCAQNPNAASVLLQENVGGEAINIGLGRSRGRLIHISENDLEYLPGWSDKVVELFNVFPRLGQLSLFGPVPLDEEAWNLRKSRLRHAKGRIVYETKRNVTTSSVLRRDLVDRGIQIGSYRSAGGHLLPDDSGLSEAVKAAGFMVAWADHYLVKNLGHYGAEFEQRREYYRESYRSKRWLGETGWLDRIAEWRSRPKPVRSSFLFPTDRTSPEKSFPSEECSEPQLWSMLDGNTAELETLEFLYGLVRLIKPRFAIETGTWHGYAAVAIGRALKHNGRGELVTLEIDPDCCDVAERRIAEAGLDGVVRVVNQSSLAYETDRPIDFMLLDSHLKLRVREFRHFLPRLEPSAVVVFHDTSRTDKAVQAGIEELEADGLLQAMLLATPRGIAICQYTGPKS